MTTDPHAALRERLRYALDMDPRPLNSVALSSGYTSGYISRLVTRRGRMGNPTLGAIWAIAQTLGVDPHWLLGSGLHEAPLYAHGGEVLYKRPLALSDALWGTVDALRGSGATWPQIASLLRDEHGLTCHHSTLRRAWRQRKMLPTGVASV